MRDRGPITNFTFLNGNPGGPHTWTLHGLGVKGDARLRRAKPQNRPPVELLSPKGLPPEILSLDSR